MRILRIGEVGESPGEFICRRSVLRPALAFAVSLLMTMGVAGGYLSLIATGQAPWGIHLAGIWFLVWCGAFALLFRARFAAALRPTNWVTRIRPGGSFLVKYRSSLNDHLPADDPTVIELTHSEIAWVRRTRETSTTHGSAHEEDLTTRFFTYLDFKLDLPEEASLRIAEALRAERSRKQPRARVFQTRKQLYQAKKRGASPSEIEALRETLRREKESGLPRSSSKWHEYPVQLAEPGILRITWNGLVPPAGRALEHFGAVWPVDENLQIASTSEVVSQEELARRTLDLLARGERLEAIILARRYNGMNLTEATRFIDECESRQGARRVKQLSRTTR